MTIINSKINNSVKDADVDSAENKCKRKDPTHSCEVMIDFKTCLCPPPKKNTKVNQCVDVSAKIEKICAGKVIIGGIVHKTIIYTPTTHDGLACNNCTKHKDIPFSCFIDIDCNNPEDKFEIVDCRTICTFSEVINTCKKAILVEKDIIKIKIKRIPCSDNCKKKERCKFCGKAVVESEICFVPAIASVGKVIVDVDPANFHIELICCNLIVVCGFITKKVFATEESTTPFKTKDIPVQIEVPAEICSNISLTIDGHWKVTEVEVCTGCYTLTCPNIDGTLFHKLIEKDIIAVQVEHKHKCLN